MKVGLEPTTWVLNMTLLYHLSYFIHCEPAGPLKDTTGSDCYVSKFCVPPKNLLLWKRRHFAFRHLLKLFYHQFCAMSSTEL